MKYLFFILITASLLQAKPAWLEATLPPHQMIGSAPATANATIQNRMALMQAKSELAKNYQIRIYNELLLTHACKDDACRKTLQTRSIQESHAVIGTLKVIDRYTDTQTGTLFVLIEVENGL